MPNSLAYLALIAWPLLAVGLFLWLSLERAVIWSILGAYLVLPPVVALDFPLLPPLDKVTIPNVAALAICILLLGKRMAWLPKSTAGRVLAILFVFSPVATVLTNSDPIPFAIGGLPGLRIHDALSVTIQQTLALAPFLLARQFLATEAAQREILLALVVACLAYSIPMLIEIRLSPQINIWVYGFFQHDFTQTVRYGGYRPIVFLPHGLWVALFSMTALLAAVALWRHDAPRGRRFLAPMLYLWVLLALCKSVASLLYAAFLVPVIALAGARIQVSLALLLAMIAVGYPLLRGADLVPARAIVARAERIDPDRAQSLGYRFANEDVLLAKANEKPFFGWGSWGRNHVHDPISGRRLTITDGRWIIVIGTLGWFGYVGEFGLLALPLFMFWRMSRRGRGADLSPFVGPLALITGINLIDMLPNATLIPFTWLIAGSILGHAEALAASQGAAAPSVAAPAARLRADASTAEARSSRTVL